MSVNSQNKNKSTPLHYICESNNLNMDIISYLVESKIDINLSNIEKETALTFLCKNEKASVEIVKYLFDNKADVNVKSVDDSSLLHILCENSIPVDIIEFLVHKGLDVNLVKNKSLSVLHVACKNKNISLEVIKILVERKCDINLKDKENNTPLHIACLNDNMSPKIIKYLLENKSEINLEKNRKSPLHCACESNNINIEVINDLINHKCDINLRDKHKNSPLNIALENKCVSVDIIKFLVENKANLLLKDFNKNRPLHTACLNENINVEGIEYLVEKKCDLNCRNENGDIAIHFACYNKFFSLDILKLLVEKKSDLNITNQNGYNALHLVCKNSNVSTQILEYLIENKCDINLNDQYGNSALHLSFLNSYTSIDVFKFLIEKKSDLNLNDNKRNSPLHLACSDSHSLEIIKFLVENKSNLNALNDTSNTPLHNITSKKYLSADIMSYLIESKCDLNHLNNSKKSPIDLMKFKKTGNLYSIVYRSYTLLELKEGEEVSKIEIKSYFIYHKNTLREVILDSIKKNLKHHNTFQTENMKILQVMMDDTKAQFDENDSISYLLERNNYEPQRNNEDECFQINLTFVIEFPSFSDFVCEFYDEKNHFYSLQNCIFKGFKVCEGTGTKMDGNTLLWEGEWKNSREWVGSGKCIWKESEELVWSFKGKMSNGEPDAVVELKNVDTQTRFKGRFENGKRNGKSIVNERGKEFYVFFERGKELSRERTFQGVRVMIVGCENVGKTSFKRRITSISNPIKNRESHNVVLVDKKEEHMTHGVDISKWKEEKILFSIWDFAGHEEYHVAHSFFFSGGCIYILLFDCSYNLDVIMQENKLLYWLYFLFTQVGKDATIILLATKLDLLETKLKKNKIKIKKRIQQIDDLIRSTIENNNIDLKFHIFAKKPSGNINNHFFSIYHLIKKTYSSYHKFEKLRVILQDKVYGEFYGHFDNVNNLVDELDLISDLMLLVGSLIKCKVASLKVKFLEIIDLLSRNSQKIDEDDICNQMSSLVKLIHFSMDEMTKKYSNDTNEIFFGYYNDEIGKFKDYFFNAVVVQKLLGYFLDQKMKKDLVEFIHFHISKMEKLVKKYVIKEKSRQPYKSKSKINFSQGDVSLSTVDDKQILVKSADVRDFNNIEMKEPEPLLLDKSSEEYTLNDLFKMKDKENKKNYYFFTIKNRELCQTDSGLKYIFDILCNEYDDVRHGVSANLTHKMVYELIQQLSTNEASDNDEDEKKPFVEVSLIRDCLRGVTKGEFKIDRIRVRDGFDEDEEEVIQAKESIEKLETILVELHKLGVIIFFDDISLKDVVVPDPKWFNKVFKVIIDIGRRKIQLILEEILDILSLDEENSEEKVTNSVEDNDFMNNFGFLSSSNEGSDYFLCFQNNDEKEFSKIRENCFLFLKKFMKWVKGVCVDMYFDDIWNDLEERKKSNVDKISFTTLLVIFQFVQNKLINENKEDVINDLLKNRFNNIKDLSQLFLSLDEEELETKIIEEILGNDFRNDIKKKDFMIEILLKFDFLLLKGRQTFGDSKNINSARQYLIPLLFPKHKPTQILLNNPNNIMEDEKFYYDVSKNFEWTFLYFLPFKPSSLWKMLFIRIRNACVSSENIYKMLSEYYWMNGVVFYFENLESHESSILELEFFENNEQNEEKKRGVEVVMKVRLKTNENPHLFFTSIHNSIKSFVSKWMAPNISKQIKVKCIRKSMVINQKNQEETPVDNLLIEYNNTEEKIELSNLPKTPNLTTKSQHLKKIKCTFCGLGVTLDEEPEECGNCTNEFLIEKQFAVIKYVAQGGFGRLIQAKHIETSTIVAMKERRKDNEESKNLWQKEIDILRNIEVEIPDLTTPRLICTLNDTSLKVKDKYLVMEWIEGTDMMGLNLLFKKISNEKEKEKEFVRMMLILINELGLMHAAGYLHRDLKPDNMMYYEKDGKIFYVLIDFGSSLKHDSKDKIPTNSPPYSAPELNTNRECFKSDVFSLGASFEKMLGIIDFKTKISQQILEVLGKMKDKNLDERISLDKCKDLLMDFVDLNLGKEFCCHDKSFYEQPKFSNIEFLRKNILSQN